MTARVAHPLPSAPNGHYHRLYLPQPTPRRADAHPGQGPKRREVEAELRARVEKKLAKVARQVSPLAELEVELREETNPSNGDSQIAEATLHLKGVTSESHERSTDMAHSINLVAEDLARQVKKHRDKRRARRDRESAAQSARCLTRRKTARERSGIPLLPSLRCRFWIARSV